MVKQTHATKGQFLLRKLSTTKLATVKKHFPEFRRREQKAERIPIEMDIELLRDFIDFLGFKDPDFTGLPEKVYDTTTYKGTKMIWDLMKKHLFKGEERPVTR